jgi:chromatin remodeling complex protein RSC6
MNDLIRQLIKAADMLRVRAVANEDSDLMDVREYDSIRALVIEKYLMSDSESEEESESESEEEPTTTQQKVFSFNTPIKITNELCDFLEIPKGSMISRMDVTKRMMDYIKAHNLMDRGNISPNNTLCELLQVKATDKLTVFNLQRYLLPHYIKGNSA